MAQVVFNPDSYPNFLRFLRRYPHLKILSTSMAFAISRDLGKFEWSGHNLSTVFCQRWRILDPKMWRLIYDVLRFNACARRLIMGWNRLTSPLQGHDMTIGEYLRKEGYSEQFSNDFLLVRPRFPLRFRRHQADGPTSRSAPPFGTLHLTNCSTNFQFVRWFNS